MYVGYAAEAESGRLPRDVSSGAMGIADAAQRWRGNADEGFDRLFKGGRSRRGRSSVTKGFVDDAEASEPPIRLRKCAPQGGFMTDPDEQEQPCFITEEIEAQMIAKGFVFEVPARIRLPLLPDEDTEPKQPG